jgi:hypothetical protein
MPGGSLKVLREKRRWMGGEGLLEPRRVGGDATCGEIDVQLDGDNMVESQMEATEL